MKGQIHLIALSVLLASCSPSADTNAAEHGVAAFHQAMNSEQYAQIYDRSDSQMKQATSRDRFVKLITIFHNKLGLFRTGKTVGWNDNATASGRFVTLNREAQFERGPATEEFIFRVAGDQAVLVGYHVNSDLLITD